ncbi:MAG: M18 family aminopeptidase [Acholeplasmatales bacterium]|nr:M18 family aminopeptidase [Acholeplasmatales bacterium]
MEYIDEFLDFIKYSKSQYHACEYVKNELIKDGFIELNENEEFNIKCGNKYFFTRNKSSIFAFTIPNNLDNIGINITAAHLDSPTLKLKPNALFEKNGYYCLDTEVYGGPIYSSFTDRPLDISGRVFIKNKDVIESKLFSFDKGVCSIPNLCIHFNREINKGFEYNTQENLIPILCKKEKELDFNELISEKLNVNKDDILSFDLSVSVLDRGQKTGLNDEFVMSPQIDNLECSYALYKAILGGIGPNINVVALFDNEEIGSRTRQGAQSTVLKDTLDRILDSLKISKEKKNIIYSNAFMISADNAHAFHPLYPQKYDSVNRSYLNGGVVIKSSARGCYTTDGLSMAIFKNLCEMSNSKYQLMSNRSDVLGGSTLGCLSLEQLSIPTVDIGLPQLSMHSSYEMAGSYDIIDLIKVIKKFYEIKINTLSDSKIKIGE